MRAKWSAKLSEPVTLRDGRVIATLQQAADLALSNTKTGDRNAWQHLAKLLVVAAESGKKPDIAAATEQLRFALFMENRLKLQE